MLVQTTRSDLSPADVQAVLAALLASTKPNAVSLSQWRNEVLCAYQKHHGNTRTKMRTVLREIITLAGEDATTAELTPALVDRFACRIGRASSVNGLLASLRCALKIAADRNYVRPELLAKCKFRIRDRDAPRMKHHSRESIARVLDHLRAGATTWLGKRLFTFATILAYTGLRPGEAKRLRVEDIRLDRGFLFVKPNGVALKTPGSEAPVPIPDTLAAVLRDWIPICRSEWLIPKMKGDGPWTGGSHGNRAGDILREEAASIGVAGFTPYSLRHSLATHLTGTWGLSRSQIRMILRHTSERTQDYYVHADLVTLRELVRDVAYTSDPKPALLSAG
jgi:integrase